MPDIRQRHERRWSGRKMSHNEVLFDATGMCFRKERNQKREGNRMSPLDENRRLEGTLREHLGRKVAPSRSEAMKHVYKLAEKAVEVNANVLVCGEGGTGKELIARMIHYGSERAEGPFIAVNCAAVPAPLLRRELFGYAEMEGPRDKESKAGGFEVARGGTLFIDEISNLPMDVQAETVRVVESMEFRRIGCTEAVRGDVRTIASTSLTLEGQVEREAFSQVLFRLISAMRIDIPPLRNRVEDIPLLSYHFLREFAGRVGKRVEKISREAMALLQKYPWPGNVSELRNTIERAVLLAEDRVIGLHDLSKWLSPGGVAAIGLPAWAGAEQPIPTLEEMKIKYMKKVLELCGGNKHRAAKILGITPVTLWRRLGAG